MVLTDHLITVTQFEQWIALPENAQRRLELFHGRIIEDVTTEEHSIIAANIYDALRAWVKQGPFGRVLFEVYHRSPDDEYTVVIPDVEFTRQARLLAVTRQGAVPQMPDLAVEVKSPGNTFIELREKALYYLKHGASEVWLVFPERQSVEVHNAGPVQVYQIADTLESPDLLPGFALPVTDIFSN
ncbi:MAG: Uma2 family endonuclease [Anaerolineae bacterium]|jgi:Uma2 family endonuclease|nr:Uma2 family endonuclease [Anaerolineae bacterium]